MLPAPGTLKFHGPFDVREDEGGLGMVVRVPESDAGDETLSYIRVFTLVQRCLETQPVHVISIQWPCCSHQFPVCLIQSKWVLLKKRMECVFQKKMECAASLRNASSDALALHTILFQPDIVFAGKRAKQHFCNPWKLSNSGPLWRSH